jgi:tetratricopeptide (TPR) repeat protein
MLVDRFLSQVYDDVELRELVTLCAVPRNFDFDVIRALWGREDVTDPLDRLRRFSFVRVRGDGRWSIHNVVRQAINDRLRSQTPQRWCELNEAAVAFYRRRAEGWPLYSDEWRWLTLERLYHQIHVREEEGIQLFAQLFETAKRLLHYDFCSELLSTFDEIELQRPVSERWIAFYQGKMGRLVESTAWDQAHAVNQALYGLPDLDPALRARVTTDMGRYFYHISCRYPEAVAALEESLALRRQLDGDLGEAYVLSHLAPAYAAAGLAARAREAGERCVALSQRLNDPYREGWGHYSLGESANRDGDWAAALGHLERASALFQSLDAEFELGVVLRRAGRAHLHLGQWEPARANFESNLALMRRYDKHAWALRALVDLCEVALASGDLTELEAPAEEARAILTRYPYPDQEARLYLTEAEAALLADEDGGRAALSYVDALLALVRAHGCVSEEITDRYHARLAELEAEGREALARTIADRVQGDIEAALAGQLVRGGSLVVLDEASLARLGALEASL